MPVTAEDLTVVSEELPGSELGLTIEVPQAAIEEAYDKVLNRLARRAKIEGFRPGRAPLSLVEARLGPAAIREEVIDQLVPEVLSQVLEERNIAPIARPRVDILELERGKPGRFSATVPVMPEVTLPDLHALSVERHVTEVTEEMVARRLEALREALAEVEPVDREAREGDLVIGDIEVEVDGKRLPSQSRQAAELDLRPGYLLPELMGALVGKRAGETATTTITLPEDFSESEVAGQPAQMSVAVQAVKERHLPDLDDELANKVSDGKYQTPGELEAGVRSDLGEQARRVDELALEQGVLKAVVEGAQVEVPNALVDAQLDRELDDLERRLTQQGVRFERYLAYQGMTKEQWREQSRPEAVDRLKVDLVLDEVTKQEHIEPSAAEIDAYIEREAAQDEDLKNQIELLKRTDSTRRFFQRRLQRVQTLQHLVELAGGPTGSEDKEETSPKPD